MSELLTFCFYIFCLQNNSEQGAKLSVQREKQKELISKLKTQLEDLEMYAYEVRNVTTFTWIV